MNRWLRQIFRKQGAGRERPICHLRENGPIGYERDFFQSSLEALAAHLRA